jgi:crotonobetainyl-CoA:carnitine CoA-transferase CaiB-like acyl-CoA transferase
MPQPLAGLRVADFSHVMAGPFCTHFLRMLGAEVIKVESPAGDNFRNYGPFREYDGISPAFIAARSHWSWISRIHRGSTLRGV